VVFKEMILPVQYTSLAANQMNVDIAVNWKVVNEKSVHYYEVEKSLDGSGFNKIATVMADLSKGGSYNLLDEHPSEGWNYFRIKSVDYSGKESYSEVVKVFIGSLKPTINIYPNPVTNGLLNVKLSNQPPGKYVVRLVDNLGQIIVAKEMTHGGGNGTITIKWNYHLAHGVYQLQVEKPDHTVQIIKVLY
jgi:hypothetical protein